MQLPKELKKKKIQCIIKLDKDIGRLVSSDTLLGACV